MSNFDARSATRAPESALPEGFVYLDEALSGVAWDAKYATRDNFTGQVVDGYASNRVALAQKMVGPLSRARDLAAGAGYGLLVWDAARPQRAVDCFAAWAALSEDNRTRARHYPNLKRSQLFELGYIARRSGHSSGRAIDLTLTGARSGRALDMGGCFDLMDERSHHGAAGLTPAQALNRAALRDIMCACGFADYQNEWWHYSLIDEPFPGQYFDFIICGEPRA